MFKKLSGCFLKAVDLIYRLKVDRLQLMKIHVRKTRIMIGRGNQLFFCYFYGDKEEISPLAAVTGI